jgi:hypothetical protein
MPILDLTDDELRYAAEAARGAARRAQKDSSLQPNLNIRSMFAAMAAGYRRLAVKFEEGRQRPTD